MNQSENGFFMFAPECQATLRQILSFTSGNSSSSEPQPITSRSCVGQRLTYLLSINILGFMQSNCKYKLFEPV